MMHQRSLIIFVLDNFNHLNYFFDLILSILTVTNFAMHHVVVKTHAISTSLLIFVLIDHIR